MSLNFGFPERRAEKPHRPEELPKNTLNAKNTPQGLSQGPKKHPVHSIKTWSTRPTTMHLAPPTKHGARRRDIHQERKKRLCKKQDKHRDTTEERGPQEWWDDLEVSMKATVLHRNRELQVQRCGQCIISTSSYETHIDTWKDRGKHMLRLCVLRKLSGGQRTHHCLELTECCTKEQVERATTRVGQLH